MTRLKEALQRWGALATLLALWELLSRLELAPSYLFPGPTEVWKTLWGLATDGRLSGAVFRSLGRLMQGYFLSILIGVPLGIAIARNNFFRMAVKPIVTGLQALPSICWLPLAILWLGLSEGAIIFV